MQIWTTQSISEPYLLTIYAIFCMYASTRLSLVFSFFVSMNWQGRGTGQSHMAIIYKLPPYGGRVSSEMITSTNLTGVLLCMRTRVR